MSEPRIFTFNGKSGDWRFWSKETGVTVGGLQNRFYNFKWPIEKVLSTPLPKIMPLPKRGEKHGRLTIQKSARIYRKGSGNRIYCRCDCKCGRKGVIVDYRSMVHENTQSCGCIRRERAKKLIKQLNLKQKRKCAPSSSPNPRSLQSRPAKTSPSGSPWRLAS